MISYSMPTIDDLSPVAPSTSPVLTETLELSLFEGLRNSTCQLLDLPSGLHFQKLQLSWYDKRDLHRLTGLVVACVDALEYLDITDKSRRALYSVSLLNR